MKTRIDATRIKLRKAINIDPKILSAQLYRYIHTFDEARSDTQKYHHQDASQVAFYRDFLESFPSSDLAIFHKLVMLDLIDQFPDRVRSIKIPDSIHEMFQLEFDRILNTIEHDSTYKFDWSNDVFVKDLGICTFRMIPAGAQLVELSGIPKKWLFSRPYHALQSIWFLLFKMKGAKPTYEIHTHSANLTDFNPDGWNRCYVRIGQLLKLNPEIKGMQGSSWFYDPALEQVSPRLTYLREVPCENGAHVFFVRNEGQGSNALAKSKSRYDLYAEGKYTPKAYLLMWPRQKLIDYSDQNLGLIRKQ